MAESQGTKVKDSEIKELPAVATNFFYWCKKCEQDRYHKVLTHPTKTSAKLECEVCSKKSTFKLGGTKKKKTATRKRKKTKSPEEAWQELKENVDLSSTVPYSMTQKFKSETAIDHPKFGLGVVTEATGIAIQVTFEDGERSLVHNRG